MPSQSCTTIGSEKIPFGWRDSVIWLSRFQNCHILKVPICLSVWILFFIETLVTVLSTIAGWKFLASGWGDLAVLAPLDWAFAGIPFLSGLGTHQSLSLNSFCSFSLSGVVRAFLLLLENLQIAKAGGYSYNFGNSEGTLYSAPPMVPFFNPDFVIDIPRSFRYGSLYRNPRKLLNYYLNALSTYWH